MGYSHSWYRGKEIDSTVYSQISLDFSKIISELPEKANIIDIPDFWGTPEDIAFGGISGTCEPMIFCRITSARQITKERAREPWMAGKYFEYCKTERMPYGLAAEALLIIAKKYISEDIRIYSDGDYADWATALELCQKVLGYGKQFQIKEHELRISG